MLNGEGYAFIYVGFSVCLMWKNDWMSRMDV